MIEVKNIEKSFGKLNILRAVNSTIGDSGIIAILGPNGSGKTTFLKIILGMVIPDDGTVSFQGKGIAGAHEYRNQIGYLPQIARFPDNLTVREILKMITNIRDQPAEPDRLINLFDLNESMDKKLGNLSGGTRQKVNIVLTFMFDNPVIILDEPTAGLDPISLKRFKQLLAEEKAKGKMILITSHIMSLVEALADEVIFLLEGRVYFQGTLTSMKEQTTSSTLEDAIATILEHDKDS